MGISSRIINEEQDLWVFKSLINQAGIHENKGISHYFSENVPGLGNFP